MGLFLDLSSICVQYLRPLGGSWLSRQTAMDWNGKTAHLNDPTSRSALDILYQGVIKWGFLLKELSIQKFERNRLRVYRLDFNMNDERTYICFTIIRLFVVCCVTLPKFLIAYNIFPYLVPIKSGSRMQSECQDKEVGKNDLQIFFFFFQTISHKFSSMNYSFFLPNNALTLLIKVRICSQV